MKWSPHVCRMCGARLAQTDAENGGPSVFECGTCGNTSKGRPEGICGCGVHLGPKPPRGGKGGAASAAAQAPKRGAPRFQCAPNPEKGPNNIALYVVMFDGRPLRAA